MQIRMEFVIVWILEIRMDLKIRMDLIWIMDWIWIRIPIHPDPLPICNVSKVPWSTYKQE